MSSAPTVTFTESAREDGQLVVKLEARFSETLEQYAVQSAIVQEIARRVADEYLKQHEQELMLKMNLDELSKLVLAQVLANVADKFARKSY